ncbi:MAG TPA: DNA mismatch repair protein MutS, partial [Agriterribacter sp.]|nr:DNA mismatch repair protein MutS [Agriterribacter sp.]
MQIDKTTYHDLSVFNAEEEFSVFHKLNFTRTNGGKEWLRWMMREPFEEVNKILDTQKIIQLIVSRIDQWPNSITNGTMMMMERFYDTAIDPIPHSTDFFSTRLYKALHSVDYGLVRYSVKHFRDFVWGMQQLSVLIDAPQAPAKLQLFASRIRSLLLHEQLQELLKKEPGQSFSIKENLYYGHFLQKAFKTRPNELSQLFYQLDAW